MNQLLCIVYLILEVHCLFLFVRLAFLLAESGGPGSNSVASTHQQTPRRVNLPLAPSPPGEDSVPNANGGSNLGRVIGVSLGYQHSVLWTENGTLLGECTALHFSSTLFPQYIPSGANIIIFTPKLPSPQKRYDHRSFCFFGKYFSRF